MKVLWILFLILMGAVFTSAGAQVHVVLNVDSNPNPKIADWVNRAELAMVTVTNSDSRLEGLDYKIKVRLYVDNNLVAETNTAKVFPRNLTVGTEFFLADEVVPFDALKIYGNISTTIAKTGMLPAGIYSFCVSLVDMNNQIISVPEEVCRPMVVTDYQMPELIFPQANAQIQSSFLQGTEFVWTPITPTPSADLGVKYIFVISEVFAHQTPSQALLTNYPLVEEEVFGLNRLLWPLDLDVPEDTTQYVWGIKAVTMDDDPFSEKNGGFSPVRAFTVVPNHPVFNIDGEEEEETPFIDPFSAN